MAKPMLIAGLLFPTKGKCDDFARVIRDHLHPGQEVPRGDQDWVRHEFQRRYGATQHSPSSYEFVCELFRKRYVGWAEIAPHPVVGIQLIHVLGTPCYRFTLADGSTVEPSMKFRAGDAPKYHATDAKAAFRMAVAAQTNEERDRVLRDGVPCALTGRPLTRDTLELDHYPVAFAELLASFLESRGLRASDVPLRSGRVGAEIDDPDLLLAWLDYHAEHARLRPLYRRTHVAHTTGAPIPPAPKPDPTEADLEALFKGDL